jgi:WD40 repeat protein
MHNLILLTFLFLTFQYLINWILILNPFLPSYLGNPTVCVPRKPLEGDTSVMTYRGHSVLNTLIRCHFSPAFSTGQRYVYTGCAAGRVVIYDLLTGEMESVLKGHRACVRDVSWHPYLPELVSTSVSSTFGAYIRDHWCIQEWDISAQHFIFLLC